MLRRMGALGRFLLVIVTLVAWFAITNHCALGALMSFESKTPAAAMHCHGTQSAPAKGGGEQTPCCKILKAVTIAKVNAGANTIDFVLKDYPAVQLAAAILHGQLHTLGLDTGPPGILSFSESVLQRSILAHAPPLLLS